MVLFHKDRVVRANFPSELKTCQDSEKADLGISYFRYVSRGTTWRILSHGSLLLKSQKIALTRGISSRYPS